GDRRPHRCLCHLRGLLLARPHRGDHPGGRGRPARPGQPQRPQRGAGAPEAGAMSDTVVGPRDPYHIGSDDRASWRDPHSEHAARDLTSKRIIVGYGFWIFLLSDIVMFSAFFATYAVLSGETAGGPGGKDLFHLDTVA